MSKKRFVDMVCNSKLLTIILWGVISVMLNIGKKIKGLEIMTLNQEKVSVFKLIELMFKGESHYLQEYFRKQRTFKLG